MREVFLGRARLVTELLSQIPRFEVARPTGAFYVFPDISACLGLRSPGGRTIETAAGFAEALLEEAEVAVVPGEDFGEAARTNIRISFACGDEQIRTGIDRIATWVASLA